MKKHVGDNYDLIQQLPIGGAIRIHPSTWVRKENISHYYLTRFKGQVSVRYLKGRLLLYYKKVVNRIS